MGKFLALNRRWAHDSVVLSFKKTFDSTHRIHGTGIVTYIWLISYGKLIGKYTIRPMDPSWVPSIGN